MQKTVIRYLNDERSKYKCPNTLRYMFQDNFNVKISEKCCLRLKKNHLKMGKRKQKEYYINRNDGN